MTYPVWKLTLSLAVILGGAFAFAEGGDYFPPADKDGGWRTVADAEKIRKMAGMDLSRLDRAFEFEKETSQHGGLVVVRHGYLVYEKYFGKGNREAHPDMASNRQGLHQYLGRDHAERKARPDSGGPGNEGIHSKIPSAGFSAG
jgi:hypothetical protein